MVKDTQLYDILQLSTSASFEEISRSYKKLALKCHPDKTNHDPQLTEKFKEMTRAYEILKDSKQRSIYDKYGLQGLEGMTEASPQQPTYSRGSRPRNSAFANDIFSQVFQDINTMFSQHQSMFANHHSSFTSAHGFPRGPTFATENMKQRVDPFSQSSGSKMYRSEDIYHNCDVSLSDMYNGKTIKLSLPKNMKCPTCNGFGGGDPHTCEYCQGSGQVLKTYYNQFSQVRQTETCGPCHGSGIYISSKNKCMNCSGEGYLQSTKIIKANLLPGSKNGDKIVLPGESDEGKNIIPGDVILRIREKPHSEFKREGDNLIKNIQIDLSTALAGGEVCFKHVSGKWIKTQVTPVVKYDDVKVIEGQGMPVYKKQGCKGDLILNFSIKIPELNEIKNIEKIIEQLPPAKNPEIPIDEEVSEEYMQDYPVSKAKRRRIDDDEDDDVEVLYTKYNNT